MSYKNKRVFITGIGGFVGSYLAKELIKKGANVSGLINVKFDGKEPKNLKEKHILKKVKLIEGDLLDRESLIKALKKTKPDYIFHLAAQSSVFKSFINPVETFEINVKGTGNLLESVRTIDKKPRILFTGTSEEYGFIAIDHKQVSRYLNLHKTIFPLPERYPEIPVNESNPFRPMSPYAVSKTACDLMIRDYYNSFGITTIVARAFNHEGKGRGPNFVTSVITSQVANLFLGKADSIKIGNVNALRDWSHVLDVVKGYMLLLDKGNPGEVYNIGSGRTNSVLTYILIALETAGYKVLSIHSMKSNKTIDSPLEKDKGSMFGLRFYRTKTDKLIMDGKVEFTIDDKGIIVDTDKGKVKIVFDKERFRPSDIPLIICDNSKIKKLGFKVKHSLRDIIEEQVKFYIKNG
ncbi:MAG: NAD-dependent epimerase/dehydratase family protein [Proteobacteria bacterium]|nr:NAD-dependent epimerase/dehydratase family protein [Pseudomonadota bacterium]